MRFTYICLQLFKLYKFMKIENYSFSNQKISYCVRALYVLTRALACNSSAEASFCSPDPALGFLLRSLVLFFLALSFQSYLGFKQIKQLLFYCYSYQRTYELYIEFIFSTIKCFWNRGSWMNCLHAFL